MDGPTKAAVLDRIEEERRFWDALLAEVGEGRMEQPGVNGIWTFKDMMAHLIGWRRWTMDRLRAAVHDTSLPPPPWPPGLREENDVELDQINAYFYETNKDRPLADVLAESRDQFQQMRAAVEAIPEPVLLDAGRFPWMGGEPIAAVLDYSYAHLHEEHEPDIRSWLARIGPDIGG